MKTVIFYKSVLGATAIYSKSLSEALKADLYTFKQSKREIIEQNDLVIVASGTYIGWMPLINFLKTNWKYLQSKQVIVIAVGALSAEDPASKKSYEAIPEDIRKNVRYYKLPGRGFGPYKTKPDLKAIDPILEYLGKKK